MTRPNRRRARLNPFTIAGAALLAAYWLVSAAVLLTDPYDLYPWGKDVRVSAHEPSQVNKFLVSALAKSEDFDLIVVGASTALDYTPDDFRRAFPGARQPVNFSYDAARPKDRDTIMRAIISHSKADHVAIWLDGIYTRPAADQAENWPAYQYDHNPGNDLRMVNLQSIGATWNTLLGRGPFPGSEDRVAERRRKHVKDYAAWQKPEKMRVMARRFRSDQPSLALGPGAPCESFGSLYEQLLPEVRELSKRGKTVDLVIPPYSMAYYRSRMRPGGVEHLKGNLADFLAFRRCLVREVAGLPNVRVWGLDRDLDLITDLANFRDPSHLYGDKALQRALSGIGNPAYRLTPENVDERIEALRSAVLNYRFKNSNLSPEQTRDF